ncbi:phage tail sheath family protein [Massilia scottii]|uniref:phage tail sheath family protein n=1 Tax=Massilia scottii TaxID=3057166 RepID=UPI002796C42D|nr:phage tail sheath C-terminal domain-containing protein [Massilia sp. CCM 9029]MDQ1829291.1 phage tail sheath C-terminal domain-containing protein [Massilia sp. CCM 9029]
MAQYKTPGVYIVEKNAFPNSVVEVATAVPAFIGHTQIADYKGSSLTNKAMRISSMAEFEAHFGGPPVPVFTFAPSGPADHTDFSAAAPAPAAAPLAPAGAAGPTKEELRTAAEEARKAEVAAKAALDAVADGDTADKTAKQELYEEAKKNTAKAEQAAAAVAPVTAAGGATKEDLLKAVDEAKEAEAAAKAALDAVADGDATDKTAKQELYEKAQKNTLKAEQEAAANAAPPAAAGATDPDPALKAATDKAALLRTTASDLKEALGKVAAADKAAKEAEWKSADAAATTAEKAIDAAAIAAASAYAAARKTEAERPRAAYTITKTAGQHLLYYSMKLFFQNGGGACYIVSVGGYKAQPASDTLQAGIEVLLKEQEPTMLVIPEAVLLAEGECYSLQKQMLLHCGYKMKSRFAILDVINGDKELSDGPVNAFREGVGTSFLAFGAAYYPWVNTTIVAVKDLDFTTFDSDNRAKLKELLRNDLAPLLYADPSKPAARLKAEQVSKILDGIGKDWKGVADSTQQIETLHNALVAISPLYSRILLAVQRNLNLLPPSAAMAGLYTMVDNSRGVWKAPANVSLAAVTSPAVNITHDDQEDLNVSTTGKSINAIRTFIGEGTLVWGARTLDGNSLDWRYINVRRTMIMLEESLRLASKAYVFEPNVANTWVTIKSMARNFLTGIWKRGGLAGASPDDAFSVSVGLNETMTAEDILEGILRVTILVAVSRPAEFIEITFQQQMQKS